MSNSKALLPSTPISLLGITKLIKVIINTGSINTITTQSNSDITCNIICNRINVTTFRLIFLANYTLNFDNAYADCLNVTLIDFKTNADCIEYAFSITQITLNISRTFIQFILQILILEFVHGVIQVFILILLILQLLKEL